MENTKEFLAKKCMQIWYERSQEYEKLIDRLLALIPNKEAEQFLEEIRDRYFELYNDTLKLFPNTPTPQSKYLYK